MLWFFVVLGWMMVVIVLLGFDVSFYWISVGFFIEIVVFCKFLLDLCKKL